VTSNDEQIDLLIRRFASGAAGPSDGIEHLDADELNAFAEGALPQAARARYVSHLADCSRCRKQVSDLALASGAIARAEQGVVQTPAHTGWWATLAGLFALPVLRYAAGAAVLVLVAGVAFVALRNRREPSTLVARNEQTQDKTLAVKPTTATDGGLTSPSGTRNGSAEPPPPAPAATSAPTSQPPASTFEKQPEIRSADSVAPTEPMKEAAKPVVTEKKAEETTVAKANAPYAPPPPGETQSLGRVQSQTGGLASSAPGGPRQQVTQQADKSSSPDRERDLAKDARLDDANRKSDQPTLAMRRPSDEKLKGGPSRNMDNMSNNRAATNEVRSETPKNGREAAGEDNPEPRSVGGRKFRRQGNSWVDQKFKSSMSLKKISRGSDEFSALDSGLRSIAQQLGGEIIVVWKGKAYLIK
jgi:hypothetical protein